MSQNIIEHQTVDWVAGRIEGASMTLRTHGIDATGRMSLAVAAAAAAVTPGELLAEIDYRGRLRARKLVGARRPEAELELGA